MNPPVLTIAIAFLAATKHFLNRFFILRGIECWMAFLEGIPMINKNSPENFFVDFLLQWCKESIYMTCEERKNVNLHYQ